MSNRHYRPKTAFDIVQRLPLHRSLNESQLALVALTPDWQLCLERAVSQNYLSPACAEATQLVAWQIIDSQTNSGKLIVSCDNPANATQLRHCQQAIVDQLNQRVAATASNSTPKVHKLVIRLRLGSEQLPINHTPESLPIKERQITTSESALGAIDACHKQTSNEKLAGALKNLASTLRNLRR